MKTRQRQICLGELGLKTTSWWYKTNRTAVFASLTVMIAVAAVLVWGNHPVSAAREPAEKMGSVLRLTADDIEQQNSFYVSPNGNDNESGTQENPWRTLSSAIKRLKPGDTLYVRAGFYKGSVDFSVSGRSDAPILITAYPGETPVIDGDEYTYPQTYWGSLMKVSGDYVNVSGFEVQYSNYMGVLVTGKFSTVSNLNVHHNMENGIFLLGDNTVADGNTVWMNCLSNENGSFTRTSWASGLSAGRSPNFAIIRNNKVYNNFGEGLSTYEANGTLIEGNEVYDNWATNIYISDATNVILRNNYIYDTDETLGKNGNYVGIMLGDERYDPPSEGIVIVDNIVNNTNINLYWWQGVEGGGMKDVTIRNNTFINSRERTNIRINNGPHENVVFSDNVILQQDTLPISSISVNDGISLFRNLWSKAPNKNAQGDGDIIATFETWAAYALWTGRGSMDRLDLATTISGFAWNNLTPVMLSELMPCGQFNYNRMNENFCR